MRKLTLLLLLLLISFGVYSQECKFTDKQIDEFTKSIKIETKPFKMTKGLFQAAQLAFRKVNDNYFVFFGFTPARSSIFENDKLMFKTSDDVIISANATKTVLPNFFTAGGVSSSNISLYYSISQADIEILSKKDVKIIRIYFGDTYSDFEVSDKGRALIKQNANCIGTAKLSAEKK